MNLIIDKQEGIDLVPFCNWLIPKIQEVLVDEINENKLIKIDLFLNEHKLLYFNYNEDRVISSKNILIGAIYNLHIQDNQNEVVIEINPNTIIPNTFAKFIDIVKLINYGNLSLQGYPILDITMEFFAENIDFYYNEYLKEAE